MTVPCSGSTCSFPVGNAPDGASSTWTATNGAGGGSGPTFSHTRAKNAGGYPVTVVIQPGAISLSRSISCTNGNTTVRTAP